MPEEEIIPMRKSNFDRIIKEKIEQREREMINKFKEKDKGAEMKEDKAIEEMMMKKAGVKTALDLDTERDEAKDIIKEIYPKIIWQDMILKAPMVLAISAVFERTTMKYKERGIRYLFQEAGHLGQNLYLASTALGLKCCALGGFDDDSFNKLLDIDGEIEGVIYVFALGC